MSRRALRTPFLRLAKDGRVIDPARYTRSGGAGAEIGDQVADDRVLALVADGATVVLQGLHRLWPPVIAFAGDLSGDLGHPVQVNAYITPPSSRGFAAHYDVHDVFVLQLAGEKRWTIHPPVHPLPLRSQPWTDHASAVAAAAIGPPVIDSVLRPGDALYLPRGYLHAATALGATSAHLTVGVHALTRYTLVEEVLARAADDAELRASLPLGDVGDPGRLRDEWDVVARRLAASLADPPVERIARRLRERVAEGVRPAPIAPIAQAAVAAAITKRTGVRVRPGLRAQLITAGGHRVRLLLGGRSVTAPDSTRPALEALLGGGVHVAGELPGLDEEDGVVLVRRLLREAVVVPA